MLASILTIIIGTYFFTICCSACGTAMARENLIKQLETTAPATKVMLINFS